MNSVDKGIEAASGVNNLAGAYTHVSPVHLSDSRRTLKRTFIRPSEAEILVALKMPGTYLHFEEIGIRWWGRVESFDGGFVTFDEKDGVLGTRIMSLKDVLKFAVEISATKPAELENAVAAPADRHSHEALIAEMNNDTEGDEFETKVLNKAGKDPFATNLEMEAADLTDSIFPIVHELESTNGTTDIDGRTYSYSVVVKNESKSDGIMLLVRKLSVTQQPDRLWKLIISDNKMARNGIRSEIGNIPPYADHAVFQIAQMIETMQKK